MPPRDETSYAKKFSAWYDAYPDSRVPAKYPPEALRNRTEGRVLLEITIARSGEVVNAEVVVAEPPGVFDEVAVESALKLRYPPKQDGEPDYPTNVRYVLPFQMK